MLVGHVSRLITVALTGAVLAGFTLLGAAQPASAAISYGTAGRVNGHEAALLGYINSARTARGIPALVASPGTTDVARAWSAQLAGSSVLSHNPRLAAQLAANGSPAWHAIAENVGYASACSPKQLFDAYWASPGHRANILSRSVHYVGIGTYERAATGWSCGRAWNTIDFVDSYSSAYGPARNPPQGMAADSRMITASTTFAGFESGPDPRALTAVAHDGLSTSRPVVATTYGDDAMQWYLNQTAPQASWGSLYLRDAVNLQRTTQITVTLQAVTPTGGGVPVSVTVFRDWATSATLGTVIADGVPHSYTFAVPLTARAFMNNLRFTVSNASLTALSAAPAQRKARISLYDIRFVV